MTNNIIFVSFTGSVLVKIMGIGECTIKGKKWSIFAYMSNAYRQIIGKDNFASDNEKGVKSWEIVRSYFYKDEGVVEVRKVMVKV